MIRMKVLCKGAEEEVAFYDEEVITVGRSSKNNLQLPDNKASRKHFLFEKAGNGYRIVDMGSKNGTQVNGKKVETHTLSKGDKIVTGEATLVVLDIGFAPKGPQAGPNAKPVKASAAPKPSASQEKKVRHGDGGINIRRGPREMPLGIFDYILVCIIIMLFVYIAGVLLFALKNRTGVEVPDADTLLHRE